jgi:hypothetical protein
MERSYIVFSKKNDWMDSEMKQHLTRKEARLAAASLQD